VIFDFTDYFFWIGKFWFENYRACIACTLKRLRFFFWIFFSLFVYQKVIVCQSQENDLSVTRELIFLVLQENDYHKRMVFERMSSRHKRMVFERMISYHKRSHSL